MENINKLLNLFKDLEDKNISYAVLRNLDNRIPKRIDNTKDIDIIIRDKDRLEFQYFMKKKGFRKEKHPWDFGDNFIFLYAMDKLDFFTKDEIVLDVCYQLCCRSTDHGEWMPLDQLVQQSVWRNRKKNDVYGYYELSFEDEFIHLITRSLFDKKNFSEVYRERLNQLLNYIDEKDVMEKLKLIVFNYADLLFEQIKEKRYEQIYQNYIGFVQY